MLENENFKKIFKSSLVEDKLQKMIRFNKKTNSRFDFKIRVKNIAKSKRSQEEIVGFVLIVLLVTVIVVVFLGISIRKPVEKLPSRELESFLQSSMRVSSECYISPERRYNLKDVIVSCVENDEKCLNDKTTCEVLNETAIKILRDSWNPCPDCPTKAYRFKIYRDNNRTFLDLREGNCSGTRTYSQVFLHAYSGKITVELEICT